MMYQGLGEDRPANALTCYKCDGAGCGTCNTKGYTIVKEAN